MLWALGLGDTGWPLVAVYMVVLLAKLTRGPVVPKAFGIWLLFMLWALCSAIMLDSVGRIVGFGFRYSMYLAATVVFVYVYNARIQLTAQRVLGILTTMWFITVIGGIAGLLFPVFELRTVLSYILPQGLLSNEMIHEMAFRSLTQFNPDPNAYVVSAPRPSAPYLYANSWGNVYSVLTPATLVYLSMVRGTKRFWWIGFSVLISLIPAFLTLNRGMFLALGIALIYVGIRALMAGNVRVLAAMLGLGLVAAIAVTSLPVMERLDERTSKVSSVETRENLYLETFDRTLLSPVLGYGAPRPSIHPGAPSAGTQGQFWMVLFSHGFPGAALFVGWFAWIFGKTFKRTDRLGLLCNTVTLITVVEIFYYGILTTGLVVVMTLAAIALREKPNEMNSE
ncbi:O-antigen ligase family protein [Glutamicibacter protophormiae]|uniref:O-antigen ligase family protein n=1 Tax=Glutamicibacter protophormiae TaxID=37930 RepID=UPI0033344636